MSNREYNVQSLGYVTRLRIISILLFDLTRLANWVMPS
jgi:hypothetical protein